ncbi:hypothetical protein CRN23_04015 [Klebsiella pneumoniae]|nr:hypothetical protein CRN23_04015 [Klebsiella pneumoniae]
MINPSEVGKAGEMVRLKTLEAIWIQGRWDVEYFLFPGRNGD